jgi:hypothetical protein
MTVAIVRNANPERNAGPARARMNRVVCVVFAIGGWAYLASLCSSLLALRPPAAGFDLQLLLDAAGRVASGGSPYDQNAVASGLSARDLFYSYPPLVAQALVPVSGLPGWLVLAGSWIGAIVGLAVVAAAVARSSIGRHTVAPISLLATIDAALLTVAAAAFFLPLAVGVLFGNIDMFFPLLFGAVAVAAVGGPVSSRATTILGGAALAVASAIKLHPASLGLWLLVRATRPNDPARGSMLRVVLAAVGIGTGILVVSFIVGGIGPWRTYVEYLGLTSNADLATRVNIGPASQVALLLGNNGLAHQLAFVSTGVALLVTVASARLVRDPLEAITWATIASLIILPVTWYHYPVALLPMALAAWLRSRNTVGSRGVAAALIAAYLVADLAIALPVLLWVAVALLLVAIRRSTDVAGVVPAEAAAALLPGAVSRPTQPAVPTANP